ncbi:MAG: hypothetical protein KatS3mg004_3796 [Bryobacteraceae bacterium]|nr:MAG: hypothetical protein KatS3mg004_3796 [Bryobacteraceae bacterium]
MNSRIPLTVSLAVIAVVCLGGAALAEQARPARARQPRAFPEPPQATRLAIVPLDENAAPLRDIIGTLAASEGYEVLPPDRLPEAGVVLYLRATGQESPTIQANGAAMRAAALLQRSLADMRAAACDGCFPDAVAGLVLDAGRAAATPAQQMQMALAVRDALRTLADAGPRTAQKGEILSPAPGSTLPGSTVTFQWSPGDGVQQFWLMVGLWPGGNTIYSADQGLLTSAPVSGLPVDGRTIYVRLWSYIDNQWVYNDYQYRAAGMVAPEKAQITDPAPGSTLAGSTATFRWSAGVAVSRYYLFIGLWQGGNTLFSQDMDTAQQATVTNLPVDGATIYVRLWSYIDGAWQFNDYTYRAAGSVTPAKAEIQSPVPGAVLAGTSVTFQWSAGQAVTRYYLFVGRWPGGNTIFSQDMGTSLSATVTNLPADGLPVYVRLWSYIQGAWQFNDYTYTASGVRPPGEKGQIAAPAPGSTLPGSTVTFTWTPGSRVEKFWLFIGTSAGNNNIYGADQGTNTSATVSNLPVNGQVIYVRLWSYVDGAWQYSDASYRAAGP